MAEKTTATVLEIVSLVEKHEFMLQRLYEAFSKAVPAQAEFWLAIAAAEAKHVKLAQASSRNNVRERFPAGERLTMRRMVSGGGGCLVLAHYRMTTPS